MGQISWRGGGYISREGVISARFAINICSTLGGGRFVKITFPKEFVYVFYMDEGRFC